MLNRHMIKKSTIFNTKESSDEIFHATQADWIEANWAEEIVVFHFHNDSMMRLLDGRNIAKKLKKSDYH